MFLVLACFYVISLGCASEDGLTKKDLHKNESEFEKKLNKDASQKELLEEHNKQRESKKIKPLVIDHDLCLYAQKHAEKMAKNNSLNHSQISSLPRNFVGENIAFGQETPKQVVTSWMSSSGHRYNILNQNYKRVGFGLATDEDGRIYWCTVFSG